MAMYGDDPVYSAFSGTDPRASLASFVSPAPASALVPPPPDTPPAHRPGESTPITGSLLRAPQEAIPKNKDNPSSYTGVSMPPDGGNVSSIESPMRHVQPALQQPLRSALISPTANVSPATSLPSVPQLRPQSTPLDT